MQMGTHFAKTADFLLRENRLFACWEVIPNPLNTPVGVAAHPTDAHCVGRPNHIVIIRKYNNQNKEHVSPPVINKMVCQNKKLC